MTDSEVTAQNINDVIRKAYELYKIAQVKPAGVFAYMDDIMKVSYGSDKFYYKFPRNLIFKVTSECNLRCKHCFFYNNEDLYKTNGELTDFEKINLIKYFAEEINIMHCTLTGGEIFVSSVIYEIIKILKDDNIPLDLLTNGTLINNQIACKLSHLLNPDYDIFQISLDGANSETNDKIRGIGSYNKVIETIKNLKDYNQKIYLAVTLNDYNVNQLCDFYFLCKELGIDGLNIGRMTAVHDSHKNMVTSTIKILKNTAKLHDIYDKTVRLKFRALKPKDFIEFEEGRQIYNECLWAENIEKPCNLHCSPHHDQVAIFANGDVSLCYECDNKKEFMIGNIKRQSFEHIWDNRYSHILYKERTVKNSACSQCKYIPFCNTGCIFRAYEKYNTIDAPGFDCKYYNEIEKGVV